MPDEIKLPEIGSVNFTATVSDSCFNQAPTVIDVGVQNISAADGVSEAIVIAPSSCDHN